MTKSQTVRLRVNGTSVSVDVRPNETLLEVLRHELKMSEVKVGCLGGECGACTVLLNGKAVNSCLLLANQANDTDILTVRGLARNGQLHPLQRAFIEEGAVECGFCTPGFILSALSFLRENPRPSKKDIKLALSGNLCRCTGYENIVKAVAEASKGKYGEIW